MSDTPQATGDPPNEISIGGPIPWFSVSLSIRADDLDPDEVGRLLGIEPDQTLRKGVPLPPRDGHPPLVPQWGLVTARLCELAIWNMS